MIDLILGDCRDVMAEMPDGSIDAIITDPPYELGFMGKAWDASGIAYDPVVWAQCLRVLKPGGHLLSFGGSRTYHRMACAVEDAGFEIRDQIMWIYGSGFPKSHDIGKAIDKAAGAEREVVGQRIYANGTTGSRGTTASNKYAQDKWTQDCNGRPKLETAPATDLARKWHGWGTALKPAHEPIVVARKPFKGAVAACVVEHGTGGINVDGCRVSHDDVIKPMNGVAILGGVREGWDRPWKSDPKGIERRNIAANIAIEKANSLGRWPANVIHDGSEEVLEAFAAHGEKGGGFGIRGKSSRIYGGGKGFTEATHEAVGYGDSGSAARFFYCAKASAKERAGSTHPTIKPLTLMRYLCRLVTPPNGLILDPFAGSGTTLLAARDEGFRSVGIEQDTKNHADAMARIGRFSDLFDPVPVAAI